MVDTGDRYDPSKNLSLVALKAAYDLGLDPRDTADYLTERIGSDGSVILRPLTLLDVLEWAERECRGTVE